MKILLAINDSGCSERAVQAVARRPWPAGSQIKVVSTVTLPIPVTPDPLVLYLGYREALVEGERRRARAALDRAVERLRAGSGAPLQVAAKVVEGEPKRAIIEEAESWGADLIVVGSHGQAGVRRWLLGSVAQAVAAHAPCSVEIVR